LKWVRKSLAISEALTEPLLLEGGFASGAVVGSTLENDLRGRGLTLATTENPYNIVPRGKRASRGGEARLRKSLASDLSDLDTEMKHDVFS
jgi:hypothetical protein